MKVTLIYHSGFLVETGEAYFLFDWFTGAMQAFIFTMLTIMYIANAAEG